MNITHIIEDILFIATYCIICISSSLTLFGMIKKSFKKKREKSNEQ